MDPWGHLVPWTFKDIIEKQNGMVIPRYTISHLLILYPVDMRPTIAITKAHMKVRIVLYSHDALPPLTDHVINSFLNLKRV